MISDAGRNSLLQGGFSNAATHLAVHSAFSATGANEISGGSPAYARKPITWGTAASGLLTPSADIQFDAAAGTFAWLGFRTALTAGVFLGMVPINAGELKAVAAENTGDLFRNVAHGYSDGDRVVMSDISTAGIPAGFAEGTTYFVRDATADTFRLAATAGGTAIALSADSAVYLQSMVPVTLTGQGHINVAHASLILDATLI